MRTAGERVRVLAVGIGHGAMAPDNLPYFPEEGDETRTWKANSPVKGVDGDSMSIEWSPPEDVPTDAGPVRALKVVLTYVSKDRSVPVLELWMTRDSGIVRFKHEGRLWTRGR
jgi:hypothetical protein